MATGWGGGDGHRVAHFCFFQVTGTCKKIFIFRTNHDPPPRPWAAAATPLRPRLRGAEDAHGVRPSLGASQDRDSAPDPAPRLPSFHAVWALREGDLSGAASLRWKAGAIAASAALPSKIATAAGCPRVGFTSSVAGRAPPNCKRRR